MDYYIPKTKTVISTETKSSLFMLTIGSEEKVKTVHDVVISLLQFQCVCILSQLKCQESV